jgi:hypothetical protein
MQFPMATVKKKMHCIQCIDIEKNIDSDNVEIFFELCISFDVSFVQIG